MGKAHPTGVEKAPVPPLKRCIDCGVSHPGAFYRTYRTARCKNCHRDFQRLLSVTRAKPRHCRTCGREAHEVVFSGLHTKCNQCRMAKKSGVRLEIIPGARKTSGDSGEWWMQGACRLVPDPDIFFPVDQRLDTAETQAAIAICQSCPVLGECREYILGFESGRPKAQRYGIWAAMTPDVRAKVTA